jgi:hypothetical protein
MRTSSSFVVLATAVLCVIGAARVKGEAAASPPSPPAVTVLTQRPALLRSGDGNPGCAVMNSVGDLEYCA